MNYLLDKFYTKSSFESVNKNINIYMIQQSLRRAVSQFKTLSENDIKDLEDEVINLIEARANLVPFSFLVAPAEIGYISLVFKQKVLQSWTLNEELGF